MPTDIEKWESRVWRPDGWEDCWIWTGARNTKSHKGAFFLKRGLVAHRWGYEYYKGPIPEGEILTQQCTTEYCVNPSHHKIETVTEIASRRRPRTKTDQPEKDSECIQVEAICVHHWVIESPSGPTSLGRCKNCKKTQDFPNSSEFFGWAARAKRGSSSTTR